MKSKKSIFSLILMASSLGFTLNLAKAEEVPGNLTLEQAVSEAGQSSPEIQKAQSMYEEKSWKKVEGYSGFLPHVTASGNYLLDKNYVLFNVSGFPGAIPQIVPTTLYTFSAEVPLFDGFASTNTYRSGSAFERSAKSDLDWTKFSVNREITLQFYKALGAKLLRDVAEQNIKVLDDHLKDTHLFKRAGVSTNYDVLRVEVQVSEAKSELMNAIDIMEISRNQLGEILGNETEKRELVGSLPILGVDLIKNITADKVFERSDLQALSEKSEGFAFQEAAASRYLVPRISAFGQYQYYNNLNDRFDDRDAFRDAYEVGIMFTWNLFDGMTSIAKSKESVQQRYQTEKNLQIARVKAKQDYELWKRKFIYYCSIYKSRLSDVEKSKEAVRLAREGRRVGARTNTDLLDAETELYRSQAGAVNAQVGAVEALIRLELTLGQKIYDFN